ncbi:MAG: hypothetical protein ACODAQ_11515, partial [Phycisphaeraceae bacterium]
VYLRRNDAGETVVFREDDMQEGVAVHYEPALLLLPARLDPAEALPAQTVDVTVRRLDTGQVRDRGTCDYRIARVTHETDDDEQRYRIVQRREIDLNLASATVTIEAVHVPDRGRIAWSVERRTRIFGLLGSDRHERYEVIERVERTPRR